MSGEGIIPGRPAGTDTLDDVLAYLDARSAACQALIGKQPEHEDAARLMIRQLTVIGDDLRAGMHEGAARAQARLTDIMEGAAR
jgi:hypothetical protein